MFTQAVLPDALAALDKVSSFPEIKGAYLAGGTALALQLGHRISEDLDFFTSDEFDESILATELSSLDDFKEDRRAWGTVLGWVGKTRFSIFYYKHPLIKPTVEFNNIKLASIPDVAAMKLRAIGDRGAKRDFIDLFFVAKEYTLDEIVQFYGQKYSDLEEKLPHLIRSLAYFEDAEKQEWEAEMLVSWDWEEIKSFFQNESLRLAKARLGI